MTEEAMALLYPRPFWFQNILTGYCVRTSNYPVLRVPEIKARFMPRLPEAFCRYYPSWIEIVGPKLYSKCFCPSSCRFSATLKYF